MISGLALDCGKVRSGRYIPYISLRVDTADYNDSAISTELSDSGIAVLARAPGRIKPHTQVARRCIPELRHFPQSDGENVFPIRAELCGLDLTCDMDFVFLFTSLSIPDLNPTLRITHAAAPGHCHDCSSVRTPLPSLYCFLELQLETYGSGVCVPHPEGVIWLGLDYVFAVRTPQQSAAIASKIGETELAGGFLSDP